MNLKSMLKARAAANKQSKGDMAGAMQLYQEAMALGLDEPRYILSYAVLLLRAGHYQQARELLVKIQQSPALTAEQKTTLYANYAVCVYKMDELDKGISVLEGQLAKNPCGLFYETLGYLYVEAGELEKALSLNEKAIEYDDEDPIVLDNLGQAYFRLAGDKEKAKEYFEKACALKPTQIDTLYFLAQYDLANNDKGAARAKLELAMKGRSSPLNHATHERIEALMQQL